MRRLLIKCALWVIALSGLFYLYKTDRYLIEWPADLVTRYEAQLRERLAAEEDLLMLITFDESPPVEWARGAVVRQSGVEAVPGRLGWARRFDGHQRTHIETSVDWKVIEGSFTLATWVRLDSASANQEIFLSRTRGVQAGIKLDQGHMAFFVPALRRPQSVHYPFEQYDRWVHLVAVADIEQGEARLYEDGVLKASGPIDEVTPPHHNVEFGKRRWTGARHTFTGDLDETAMWNRALSMDEVRRLHAARRSLPQKLQPVRYMQWRAAVRLQEAIRILTKWSDHFHPGLHEGRVADTDLPELNLFLSRSDRRHFVRAHTESLRTGRRVIRAADLREIHVGMENRVSPATLNLAGGNVHYALDVRPSYILSASGGESFMGMSRVLLAPPETAGFVQPLLEARVAEHLGLPALNNGLCRLYINGEFAGIYYYEDHSRMGVLPGKGWRYAYGPTHGGDWPSLFRGEQYNAPFMRLPLRVRVPVTEEDLFRLHDDVLAETEALFLNDTTSSLNSREIAYRLKWGRRDLFVYWSIAHPQWSKARKVAEALNAHSVLADNPSPWYVTGPLDLGVLTVPDVTITWQSAHPEVITAEGMVTRPAGNRPARAELTAVVSDGTEERSKSLVFRVMPEQIKIPAVMLYVNEQIWKAWRVDAVVDYYPPGDGTEPIRLHALQHSRGGVSHRGHTGYWQRRKSFSLRLDEPHDLLDDTSTRHLLFINGPRDPAFVRNKLSYDLFRAFGNEANPRYAPEMKWVELYVNGQFHCLIEMCTRIQRRKLDYEAYDPDAENQAVIYKRENIPIWTVGDTIDMRHIYPPRRHDHAFERYRELVAFIEGASPEEFAAGIERWVDLGNVIDFQLLLNFTENRNGYPFRYALHDVLVGAPGADGRFFFAAWDFEKTYIRRDRWNANGLMRRLEKDYPGYTSLLFERWRVLREDLLDPERLNAWLDEIEELLDGHVEWEYRRWRYNEGLPHAAFVDEIRSFIRYRIDFMDARLARMAAGNDVPETWDDADDPEENDEEFDVD